MCGFTRIRFVREHETSVARANSTGGHDDDDDDERIFRRSPPGASAEPKIRDAQFVTERSRRSRDDTQYRLRAVLLNSGIVQQQVCAARTRVIKRLIIILSK